MANPKPNLLVQWPLLSCAAPDYASHTQSICCIRGFAVYIDLYTLALGHILQLVSRNGMFWPSSETVGISIVNWIRWFMAEFRWLWKHWISLFLRHAFTSTYRRHHLGWTGPGRLQCNLFYPLHYKFAYDYLENRSKNWMELFTSDDQRMPCQTEGIVYKTSEMEKNLQERLGENHLLSL